MSRFVTCLLSALVATLLTPSAAAFIAREIPFWAKVVGESGASAD